MRRTSITAVVLCLLAAGMAYAQNTAWVARYDGPGNNNDHAWALVVDADGNVYVTGNSTGSGTYADYATIKYKPNGDTAWVRRYNDPGNSADYARSIALDAAGNVYVTGLSLLLSTGSYDYLTVKYDNEGVEKWVARYDGSGRGWDQANAVAVDGAGNVYVTGYSTDINEDYATVKYDNDGNEKWVARYNGPGDSTDQANAIAVDAAGNVYVTGFSMGSGTREDYATIKYTPGGDTAWLRRYDGPACGKDVAYALAVDAAANVYVTGYCTGSGTGNDYATIKYNTAGVEQWVARYNGPGNLLERAWAIAVDAAGNVYVTGFSLDSTRSYDYATVKYNSAGVQQWAARYDKGSADIAQDIAVDAAGNVYVTGYVGIGMGTDYATIKYKPNGDTAWVRRYNGPGNDLDNSMAIAVDAAGNVYVTGYSRSGSTAATADYTTIKYTPGVGVEEVRSTPYASSIMPGATVTRGALYLATGSRATSLLDATGRKAARLSPGPNDVSALAPGVYFVRPETGNRLDRVVIAR